MVGLELVSTVGKAQLEITSAPAVNHKNQGRWKNMDQMFRNTGEQ